MTPPQAGTPLDYGVICGYFLAVTLFGVWFGRYAGTTKDYFFGGQRFAWWIIAFSAVASTVGSYSFIKYSEVGYSYGISSTQSYLNDWFWMPVLLLVWLPIIYFQRIRSVPEYFERRFGSGARLVATAFILFYLVGYIGVNLLTLGKALQPVLGWGVFTGAAVTCLLVTVYVFAGGQTSVIMTDLAQGIILLAAGLGLFLAGVVHLGGWVDFWSLLPQGHRYIFSEFNSPDNFSFVGIFAQDGLANTGAFMLMNQGMMMRFLAVRSVSEARKMAIFWILVLTPLAAVAVSGGGWVARAMAERGELETSAEHSFIFAAEFLCRPGVFGFVLAALMAALMSTADTLINAVAAIFVNDVYQPYVRPGRDDRHYLRVARLTSLCAAFVGLALVPIMAQGTIYQAHAMFTAAVTPPILMAILLGVFWKRFNTPAVMATLLGGGFLVMLTFIPPLDRWFLAPFSFGMGTASHTFTRALYGLVVSTAAGVPVALLTRPQPMARLIGLVNGSQVDAMRVFKGGEVNRLPGGRAHAALAVSAEMDSAERVLVPQAALDLMRAEQEDIIYVCDARWWLGGLKSIHARVGGVSPDNRVHLSRAALEGARLADGARVFLEKTC